MADVNVINQIEKIENTVISGLKDFQKANDLLSYGVLDIPTQKKIEKVFSKIEVTTDNQFEKAYELMGGNLEDLN